MKMSKTVNKKFAVAAGQRVQVTNAQKKQIQNLYKDVADEMADIARSLANKDNISSVMRAEYLKSAQREINSAMKAVDTMTEHTIIGNMIRVSHAIVKANNTMIRGYGYTGVTYSLSRVPDDIVAHIMSGDLYKGKWNLSKAIWGDNARKLSEIDTIIAKGIAANKSAFDIAKDLEKYVRPGAVKPWDWGKVYPGSRKVIDYNAQRLARTMVSHAYQESFVRTTINNPFIDKYEWLKSSGDRVCEICLEREGKLYEKDALPLDHPNGMCTFVIHQTMSDKEIVAYLKDWTYGEGNTAFDKQMDKYADDMAWKYGF